MGGRNLVFYMYDGSIVGRDHEWVYDTLVVAVTMFCRIILEANLEKTKAMLCTPRFIWEKWGKTACKQLAEGEGETFREWKKTQVICTEWFVAVEASYINTHMIQIHTICIPHMRGVNEVGGGPNTYVLSLPRGLQEVKC